MKTANRVVFALSLVLFAIAAVAAVDLLNQLLFALQADPNRIANGLQTAFWCSLAALSFGIGGFLLLTARRFASYRRLTNRSIGAAVGRIIRN